VPVGRDDKELYERYRAYFDCNDKLWTVLVATAARPDRRFRLTLEDSDLASVDGGRSGFVRAVRKLIMGQDYEGNIARAATAADRISRSQGLEAVGSLGILGACVLAASSMTADGGFSSAAYYPRFNREILKVEEDAAPQGFSELGPKWIDLARVIKQRGLGELVIPRNPSRAPIRGKRNINYPLSQCLFRRTDVEKLQPQLQEWSKLEISGEEAFTLLLRHVDFYGDVSAALIASLESARRDPDIREAYSDALDDLIADTSRYAFQARRVPRDRVASDSAGIARLRLVAGIQQSGRLEYDIVLDILDDDSWTQADFRCESRDVLSNTIVEINSRRYRYLGADAQVFFAPDEFDTVTERTTKLPTWARLVVVSSIENRADLIKFADMLKERDPEIRDPVESLNLLERFRSLCAIRFTITAKGLETLALPPCLDRYSIARQASLRAIGGLKLDLDYLIGCPPRLELAWDVRDGLPPVLFCDGQQLESRRLSDRIEADLSEFGQICGTHYVTSSVADLKLTFKISDPEVAVRHAPTSGSYNAIYFGPQFLKFVSEPRFLKIARNQAQEAKSGIVLMHGCWFVCDEAE
jgi:hypothetical protein